MNSRYCDYRRRNDSYKSCRTNKYRNHDNKANDNLYDKIKNCDYKKNKTIEQPLESPTETQLTDDKEMIADVDEVTYDFVVVSDAEEDNIEESNAVSTSSSSVQDKIDMDTLKMNMLSYIKAVDKKNHMPQKSKMSPRKDESELNNKCITFENPDNYIKRKSVTPVKRTDEAIVDSTENITQKKRKCLCFSEGGKEKEYHAEQLVQPDSTTSDKIQLTTSHQNKLEICNNTMTSDDIKALDNALESLKTYRNIDIDSAIDEDLEIAYLLRNLNTPRKGNFRLTEFRSKSCDGRKTTLDLVQDKQLKKKQSKSLMDLKNILVTTDFRITKSKSPSMFKLSEKKSLTIKHQNNVIHQKLQNCRLIPYNKPHLIDLPDAPKNYYTESPPNDPRRSYKQMIMVKDISIPAKKIDHKSRRQSSKVTSSHNDNEEVSNSIIEKKRRKTKDNRSKTSERESRRELDSISVRSFTKEKDSASWKNPENNSETQNKIGKGLRQVENRRHKMQPAFSTCDEIKINCLKETFERVMIDNVKPFSINTPMKQNAKKSIEQSKEFQRATLKSVNVENEPTIFKMSDDIEILTKKFTEYLALYCLTTKNIKLLSNLNGCDEILIRYQEELKEKFRNNCKLVQYSNIDVKQLILNVYEKMTVASIGCSVHEVISALKITFDGVDNNEFCEQINQLLMDEGVSSIKDEKRDMIDIDDVMVIGGIKNEVTEDTSSCLPTETSHLGVSVTTTTSPIITTASTIVQSSSQIVEHNNQNIPPSKLTSFQNFQMNTRSIRYQTRTCDNTQNLTPVRTTVPTVSNVNQMLTSASTFTQCNTNTVPSYSGLQEYQALFQPTQYLNQQNNYNQQSCNPTMPQQQTPHQQVYQHPMSSYSSECQQNVNNVVYQPSSSASVFNRGSYQSQTVTNSNPFKLAQPQPQSVASGSSYGGISVRKDLLACNSSKSSKSESSASKVQIDTSTGIWQNRQVENLASNVILLCNNCNMLAFFGCSCKRRTYCSVNCQISDWVTHNYEHNR